MLKNHFFYSAIDNKNIVVTRAQSQAKSFGEKLERLGAHVLYLPLIQIEKNAAIQCPNNLEDFDWLLLTSVNAVHYFSQCLEKMQKSWADIAHCRVAVIGEATKKAAESQGLVPEVLPEPYVASALLKSLFTAEQHPIGKRILYPKGNLANPEIECALKIRGMDVSSVICYETKHRRITPDEAKTLSAFKPHIVTFFSPSAVHSFMASRLNRSVLSAIQPVVYASIGPVTSRALFEARLDPVVEADLQTEDALIDGLNDYYAKRGEHYRN